MKLVEIACAVIAAASAVVAVLASQIVDWNTRRKYPQGRYFPPRSRS